MGHGVLYKFVNNPFLISLTLTCFFYKNYSSLPRYLTLAFEPLNLFWLNSQQKCILGVHILKKNFYFGFIVFTNTLYSNNFDTFCVKDKVLWFVYV